MHSSSSPWGPRPGTAAAADLLSVYQDALANDPAIREADATRKASREARAAGVGGPAAAGQRKCPVPEAATPTRRSRARQTDPDTGNVTAVSPPGGLPPGLEELVDQPAAEPVLVDATGPRCERPAARSRKPRRTIRRPSRTSSSRAAARYFGVLSAQDTLEAQQAALDAFNRASSTRRTSASKWASSRSRTCRTPRPRATSCRDVIASKRSLATAEEQLREITAPEVRPARPPRPDHAARPRPSPASSSNGSTCRMEQNLTLVSSRLQADTAREQRAGGLRQSSARRSMP